ncbi:nucleoside recognition domain-containing protein, partial [bacterium]
GRVGRIIEPVIKPLGFDWRIGISLIAGFSAKEVIVATLGTIFSTEAQDEDVSYIKHALQKDPLFTPIAALSLMIFVLLYAPCISANIVFWKEVMSLRWTLFMLVYTISVAYIASLLVYQIGIRI